MKRAMIINVAAALALVMAGCHDDESQDHDGGQGQDTGQHHEGASTRTRAWLSTGASTSTGATSWIWRVAST